MYNLINCFSKILSNWRSNFSTFTATLIVLVGTFYIVTLSAVVYLNFQSLITNWGSGARMSVYLSESVSKQERSKISSAINSLEKFEKVEYISSEQAASTFKIEMKEYAPDLLSNSDLKALLPASFDLTLSDSVSADLRLSVLESAKIEIENMLGVDEVSFGQSWLTSYEGVLSGFGSVSLALVFLLLLGSVLIISNTIKNSLGNYRSEIEILELFGATKAQIYAPFIVEGGVLSALACSLSILLTYVSLNLVQTFLQSEFLFLGLETFFTYFNVQTSTVVLTTAMFIGSFSAWMTIRQFSKGEFAVKGVS